MVEQFEQRRHPGDHEDAGGNHGRGMDQRGNRGRAFHRVGQPDMQRHLRRLAHGADEQADAGKRHQRHGGPFAIGKQRDSRVGEVRRLLEDACVVQRAEVGENQANAEDEPEVADPVDQEGLHVGEDGRRAGVPEADQQVGDETDRLPAEEELHEIVGHHQHQHGEGKQRDVTEEAVVAGIFLHVADRVDVHHQRDESDNQHHGGRQRVDQEAHFELVVAAGQPGVDRSVEDMTRLNIAEDDERRAEGDCDAGDGHGVRNPARDHPAKKTGDNGADQRGQRNQKVKLLHFHV